MIGVSPVPEKSVELDDGLLLLQAELAPLDVRPEVVRPPEPAALAAPLQPGLGGQRAPAAVALLLNVGQQLLVLLRRPRPLLQPLLLAARRSPHRAITAETPCLCLSLSLALCFPFLASFSPSQFLALPQGYNYSLIRAIDYERSSWQ